MDVRALPTSWIAISPYLSGNDFHPVFLNDSVKSCPPYVASHTVIFASLLQQPTLYHEATTVVMAHATQGAPSRNHIVTIIVETVVNGPP